MLPDATVLEEPYPLPDLRRADANPQEQPALDASDAAHPDEAADVELPELAAEPYVEKLADPEQVFPALGAKRPERLLPAAASELCTPDAGQSAA